MPRVVTMGGVTVRVESVSRILAGDHDELTGSEHLSDIIDIDQSPIGRSSRSNPATYIGFYDAIRTLFAETDDATRRGFAIGFASPLASKSSSCGVTLTPH